MLRKIDEDEKLIRTIFLSGQNREAWFLTEDGLYEELTKWFKVLKLLGYVKVSQLF